MIDQPLDAIRGFTAWRICVVECSIAHGGSHSLEMNIVLDQNAKASKGRMKGCFDLDLRSQRKAGELAVGASRLECFESMKWAIGGG